jgi:hypothetical protein
MEGQNDKVYTVWGGHKEQDCGEHYATFKDPDLADRYRNRMEAENANLSLAITPTNPIDGETYADEEELTRFPVTQQPETPEARFDRQVAALWSTSFRALPALVETFSMEERRALARHFELLSQNAARVAAYLDQRGGCGYDLGHKKAVKAQNRTAHKVRQAQGYNSRADIDFD